MSENQVSPPPIRSVLPLTIILILTGAGGLAYAVIYNEPIAPYRWLAYFSLVLLVTGIMLPISAYLNQRFPSSPPATNFVILRQALWPGIYIPTLTWLIIGGVFSLIIAILLAIGILIIEWLLRMRERSRKRTSV